VDEKKITLEDDDNNGREREEWRGKIKEKQQMEKDCCGKTLERGKRRRKKRSVHE